jgi:hypothetical protein
VVEGTERLDRSPGAAGEAITGPPAPGVPPARLRWSAGGLVHEVPLGPASAEPFLVGAGGAARDLLAALLGALDRAAASGETRIRVRHGEVEVFVDVPEAWPRPGTAPTGVLTGPSRWAPLLPAAESEAERLYASALDTLGPEELEALRVYPRRRRAIALWRRRLESTQWQLDEALRVGRRWTVAAGGGALAAVGAALGAARWHQPALVLAAGAVTLALASAWSAGHRRTRELAARRAGRAERLARLAARHDELERRARGAAARLGVEDPWGLTARIDQAGTRRREIEARLAPGTATLAWAERIASAIGIAPPGPFSPRSVAIEPPDAAGGWPYEVGAAHAGSELRAAAALARIAERVARELPAPWPVVLFEPWAGDAPEVRARRLMALARVLPERAVVAIVTHR